MAESEAIYVVVQDVAGFYSLRLAVTPAVKARVENRDVVNPMFEGTGIQIKWGRGLTQKPEPANVRTHIRYASVEKISSDFVTDLIFNEHQGGVFNVVKETGVRTWQDMDYLPVPVPEKIPREMMAPEANESPQKVVPPLLGNQLSERTRQEPDQQCRVVGAAHWEPPGS